MENSEGRFRLLRVNESHYEQVSELICGVYATEQPLITIFGCSKQFLKDFFKQKIIEGCRSGLSFAAMEGDTMVSVLTVCTLNKAKQIQAPQVPLLRPRMALDKQLHAGYLPEDGTNIIYGLQAATLVGYEGFKFYQKLTLIGCEYAYKLGFKSFIAVTFHSKSHRVLAKKLQSKILNEITVPDFEFEGTRPFKNIQNCDQVTLFQGDLARLSQGPRPSL